MQVLDAVNRKVVSETEWMEARRFVRPSVRSATVGSVP
jgi:hypothetical protein